MASLRAKRSSSRENSGAAAACASRESGMMAATPLLLWPVLPRKEEGGTVECGANLAIIELELFLCLMSFLGREKCPRKTGAP